MGCDILPVEIPLLRNIIHCQANKTEGRDYMIIRFFMTVLLAVSGSVSCASELVFHFDFSKAAGQSSSIQDLTGKVKCYSKNGVFVVQENGLRLANCAHFYIPSKSLPLLNSQFSFNIWMAKCARGEVGPIFFKGLHPAPVQFLFSVDHLYPQFVYKTKGMYDRWQGVELTGSVGAHKMEYRDPSFLIDGKKPEITPGKWKMLTLVYDYGTISIYIDGKLTINRPASVPETLEGCDFPLCLGMERVEGSALNYQTSNALVNDWRLYSGSLSASEVEAIFADEKKKYELPIMEDSWARYQDCHEYISRSIPGYDPEFKKKLPLTADFEKRIASIPSEANAWRGANKTEIRRLDRRVGLFIGEREQFPLMYASSPEDYSVFSQSNPANFGVSDFAAADVFLSGVGVHPWKDMVQVWKGANDYDFGAFDKAIRDAIKANPLGGIQVSFFPEGIKWFQNKHGRELERCYPGMTSSGQLGILYQAPFGSDVWIECSSELLRNLVTHIESSDYAERVWDYKLFCGGGGEWYWPGCFMSATPGYSDATRDSFRSWLRMTYDNEGALRSAWGDPIVTFNSALVPLPEVRYASEAFNFRDPIKARPTIDFRRYMGDRTFDNIVRNTEAIKLGCGGKKTVTIYYGYQLFFSSTRNQTQFISGTQCLGRVFGVKSVDNIATPIDYRERLPGDPGGNYNPFNGSAWLHGKMIWQENDLRTHLFPKREYGRTNNLDETISVLQRGFGQALTGGMGIWWFAMPANYVYHDQGIMNEVKRISTISRDFVAGSRASVAEVALVFDENSTLYSAYRNSDFIESHTWKLYLESFRMGAPFDAYLIDDIFDPRVPDYKMYIFMNSYCVDAGKRNKILEKVGRRNAVSVWCYAPGFISDLGFNDGDMKLLTGIALKSEMKELDLSMDDINGGHDVTRYLSAEGSAKRYKIGPIISSVDSSVNVLGRAGGRDVLVVKEMGGWKSVYTLFPPGREMLRGLCEYAGVHLYERTGYDVIACNSGYVMLHSSSAGDKTLHLPRAASIYDVFSGKVMLSDGGSFTDKGVPFGSTRIYAVQYEK